MNILFFLKPKSEVAFIYDYSTLRQVLETMEFHKYASIPMLNKAGEYVGTMTEGDILWGIKKYTNLNLKEAETIFIQDFPRKADYEVVSADADMEDLLQKAMNQNFVPVVDDQKKFIGIITRKSIIEFTHFESPSSSWHAQYLAVTLLNYNRGIPKDYHICCISFLLFLLYYVNAS